MFLKLSNNFIYLNLFAVKLACFENLREIAI